MIDLTNRKVITVAVILLLGLVAIFVFSHPSHPRDWSSAQICEKKSDATTEENIQRMRQNLSSIVRYFPAEDIQGQIIFKQGITPEDFIRLVKTYDFHITDKPGMFGGSSIQVHTVYDDKRLNGIAGFKLTPEFLQADTFLAAVKKNSPPEDQEATSTPVVTIINAHISGRADELLKFWQEHEDLVRGVGVGCTTVFYTVGLTDPIIFGGPSILR